MLRQIFSALTSNNDLDRAFDEFDGMLESADWMFRHANQVLRREVPADEVREAIYQRDQSINKALRSIRRKIVRHLSVQSGADVPAALALMSVAKDAERIGDYCKNVFEVGRFYRDEFHVPRYHEPLEEIRDEVEQLFGAVRSAFKSTKPSEAHRVIERADIIRRRCDDIIEQLLRDEMSMETHEAVAYSLLARHYKRVAAHLANICTAITSGIEDLDFRP